ncbi:MAG: hypothetical protein OEY50_02385 [Nitrospinota bacterium]|nr:hypothetical protein [Nitrospinota bacterium]MDH5677982.1 hypothetical protein [Nitrospinota bacterium]MDH5756742.1 hypothetical protein [Nitrospinota bacterium]
MTVKSETDLMQECMTALLWEAGKIKTLFSSDDGEAIDRKILLEFAERMREIHIRLISSYNPTENRSKILERFFLKWNNMLFGIFYIADQYQSKGFISSRQIKILTAAVEEIVSTLEKNPLVAKRAFPTREEP